MILFVIFFFFFLLVFLEIFYFKIADKYNIIDQPNHRSSHTTVTIRGGGVIFTISILIASCYLNWVYSSFIIGLLLISLVSFIDDIKSISNKIRIIIHFVAVGLMFFQIGLLNLQFYWVLMAFVLVIGTINAINFMDGINGITGGFGFVTLSTLFYINTYINLFTKDEYLVASILSLLVFNFFNFRKKAKCFAGDVGSVSLAFIILFFLLQLILKTSNLNYLLLMLIYGLDVVTTILFRILRKENIFEAHRSHFYQFLANKKNVPHITVALLYTLSQGIVNALVVFFFTASTISLLIILCTTTIAFIIIRMYFEGTQELIKPQ